MEEGLKGGERIGEGGRRAGGGREEGGFGGRGEGERSKGEGGEKEGGEEGGREGGGRERGERKNGVTTPSPCLTLSPCHPHPLYSLETYPEFSISAALLDHFLLIFSLFFKSSFFTLRLKKSSGCI